MRSNAPDEDELASQFQLLQELINQNGWEQYELSNYCKNSDYALHNSAYWQDRKYLGLGPSAHSYDLKSRQWNLASNQLYTKAVLEGTPYFELEEQSERDWYHDTLISRLRTKWGIPEEELHDKFSNSTIEHFKKRVDSIRQFITLEQGSYRIQRDHWFTSDNLLEKLMLDE